MNIQASLFLDSAFAEGRRIAAAGAAPYKTPTPARIPCTHCGKESPAAYGETHGGIFLCPNCAAMRRAMLTRQAQRRGHAA